MLSGRTHVTFIGHFLNDYGTDDIEYMFPYFFDKLCIVAPKAPRIPGWMAIFQCYDITVWISLLIMNSLCGGFWYILKRTPARFGINMSSPLNIQLNDLIKSNINRDPVERRIQLKRRKQSGSLGEAFINMWFIMVSGPLRKLPYRKIERIFLATCFFSNVIFIGTFQVDHLFILFFHSICEFCQHTFSLWFDMIFIENFFQFNR